MNKFEEVLYQLHAEGGRLKEREVQLNADNQLFMQKLQGFLRENGLPDSFTMTDLALMAIRKSKESVIIKP